MLPQSHIAYTFLAYDLIKKYKPAWAKIDYRLLALAAMGPDMIDKPLALLYFYKRYRSAVLFAHTLLAHLGILLLTWLRTPWSWVYTLAFIGHAILDRLWFFPDTWYWPFRGWRFHVWKNEQKDLKGAYWYAFTRRPELIFWEVGALLAALWFIKRHRLYQIERLWHFLRYGQPLE